MFSVEQLAANVLFDKLRKSEEALLALYPDWIRDVDGFPDYDSMPAPGDVFETVSEEDWNDLRILYSLATLIRLAYEMDFEDSENIAYPESYYSFAEESRDSACYSALPHHFDLFAIVVIWALENDPSSGHSFLHEEWQRFICDALSIKDIADAEKAATILVEELS